MSGIYWGVTSMYLLSAVDEMNTSDIVDWLIKCQHPSVPEHALSCGAWAFLARARAQSAREFVHAHLHAFARAHVICAPLKHLGTGRLRGEHWPRPAHALHPQVRMHCNTAPMSMGCLVQYASISIACLVQYDCPS